MCLKETVHYGASSQNLWQVIWILVIQWIAVTVLAVPYLLTGILPL